MYDHGFFSDYQEPNTWDRRFKEIKDRYLDHVGRHEVKLFEVEVLGKNQDEEQPMRRLFHVVKRG